MRAEWEYLMAFGHWATRKMDDRRQRRYGIFTFSVDPRCVLRAHLGRSRVDVRLADGTYLLHGDPILELHLWNEQLPPVPENGVSLAWGIEFARRVRLSLRELAEYLEADPILRDVRALHGEIGFITQGELARSAALARHLGFDLHAGTVPGWRPWKIRFWRNVGSWWMMSTFSPASLRGKHFGETTRS
jgi:hypothetical protein